MTLTFITGNAGKFSEAEAILGVSLNQEKVHLPEIQSLDPREVMEAKLESARAAGIGRCIVEDSSLTLGCLRGTLPGPFIKWFEDALGIDGIVTLTQKQGDTSAISSTMVGYLDEEGNSYYFEGSVAGNIVPARGDQDFGYGPVFQPEGNDKTFGEMTREEKHAVSSRAIAFRALREHLRQE
jgi:inosine triphosphate pyrophosphatase